MIGVKQLPRILGMVFVTASLAACSTSAPRLNQVGNDRFSEEAFTEALQAYEAAQIQSPELAEPYYNAANALYRQGNYEQALVEMQKALSYADQDYLRSSGYFNLGNTAYNQGEMDGAIGAYIETLLLNPEDMEAKYNLELALQEQSQEQSQQESQENQSDESESETEQGGSKDQEPSENGMSNNDQKQDQDGETQEDPNDHDQGQENEPNENEDSQDGQGDKNQSESETDETVDEDGDGEPEDQNNNQGQQPGEGGAEDRNPSSQRLAPGQRMTAEQAKQLLAAIAQDAQTLQEKLGQILFVQAPPPIQDW